MRKTSVFIAGLALIISATLSPIRDASADTYIVTTTDDPGAGSCTVSSCSLHDAIDAANANAGADTITFAIPGSGVPVILPNDPLPSITDPVTIDATTQNPSSTTPPVELRGHSGLPNEALWLTTGSDGSTIKGFIINRFNSAGILISNSQQNTIAFNWIGIDATGLAAGRNAGAGVFLQNAPKNTIGGQGATARNVLSGNGGAGVQVGFEDGGASSENVIQGNYIGTDYLGVTQISNEQGAVYVSSSKNTIGGTLTGQGNVITGYDYGYGLIYLRDNDENLVYGNYIGTNAAGTASLSENGSGSQSLGIIIEGGQNNRIGTAGAGNLISGTLAAIKITDKISFSDMRGASGNIVQGNMIGTDATGMSAIPNAVGIRLIGIVSAVSNNTIGGYNAGEGNLISGNGTPGEFGIGRAIEFGGPETRSNKVLGNFIGVASDHVTPLGNSAQGILVFVGYDNLIGDTGAGNVIAYNGDTAIRFVSGTGNKISQNSIFGNGGFGINQGPGDHVDPNDVGDADGGPNNLQNFPDFAVTVPSKGKILLKGTLDSAPSASFTLEFFLNDEIDDSGYGEGKTYLGSEVVTTDASGNATFSKTLTATVPANGSVTATATDSLGNTSEFSLGVQPTKDLSNRFTIRRAPVVVVVGDDITISLPLFKIPKKLLQSNKLGTRAARSSVQYQLTITPKSGGDIRKITSKKNILTLRDLTLGNYDVAYVAKGTQGKKVVSKSKASPKKLISVTSAEDDVEPF